MRNAAVSRTARAPCAAQPGSALHALATGLLLVVAGCIGSIDSVSDGVPGETSKPGDDKTGQTPSPSPKLQDPTEVPKQADSCTSTTYAPGAVRLFTPVEYANTVRSVALTVAGPGIPLKQWDAPPMKAGFTNQFDEFEISSEYSDVTAKNAQILAGEVVKNRAKLVPGCAGSDENACATEMIAKIGKLAFLRPLTATELMRLAQHHAGLRKTWSAELSLHGVAEIIFALPPAIHRSEVGEPVPGNAGVRQLTSYEMASLLSYSMTLGPPDAALMTAADANRLLQPEDISAHVGRLIEAKSVEGLSNFFVDLLDIDRIMTSPKDPMLFSFYKENVPKLLFESFQRSASVLVTGSASTFSDYLTTGTVFVQKELAPLLDVTSSDASLVPRDLGTLRSGLYTHPAFLASEADDKKPKPIHRARFALEGAMCVFMAPPPAAADDAKASEDPNLSDRQNLQLLTKPPQCEICHRTLNPVSYAFEAFDAVGRVRLSDEKGPIDPSGTVVLHDKEVRFANARGLFEQISAQPTAKACFVTQWYTYMLGRELLESDACSRRQSYLEFERNGWKLQTLLKTIFVSDSFRFRKGA